MIKGKTVSSVVALVAFAFVLLFAYAVFNTAQSQQVAATRGPYMIAAGDKMMVWRIDQASGRISYCMRDTQSMDPKFIATRAPYCSAWTQD